MCLPPTYFFPNLNSFRPIPIQIYRDWFQFWLLFIFFIFTLKHPTHYIWTGIVHSSIVQTERYAWILFEMRNCVNIYYKKALELWLRIVCSKTNMEKGLFVLAIWWYFFCVRTQCHIYPLLDETHFNHRNIHIFIHNIWLFFFVSFKNSYMLMHVNSSCVSNERDFEFSTFTIGFVVEKKMEKIIQQ